MRKHSWQVDNCPAGRFLLCSVHTESSAIRTRNQFIFTGHFICQGNTRALVQPYPAQKIVWRSCFRGRGCKAMADCIRGSKVSDKGSRVVSTDKKKMLTPRMTLPTPTLNLNGWEDFAFFPGKYKKINRRELKQKHEKRLGNEGVGLPVGDKRGKTGTAPGHGQSPVVFVIPRKTWSVKPASSRRKCDGIPAEHVTLISRFFFRFRKFIRVANLLFLSTKTSTGCVLREVSPAAMLVEGANSKGPFAPFLSQELNYPPQTEVSGCPQSRTAFSSTLPQWPTDTWPQETMTKITNSWHLKITIQNSINPQRKNPSKSVPALRAMTAVKFCSQTSKESSILVRVDGKCGIEPSPERQNWTVVADLCPEKHFLIRWASWLVTELISPLNSKRAHG